jgi:NTP pyrophosphatase (non-canonical NTP hydrolase)
VIDDEYFGKKSSMTPMPMNLDKMIVDCINDSQRWFPDSQSLPFLALCLAGEVGEVANILKKVERGSDALDEPRVKTHLEEEIVDVLIYLCNMMGHREFQNTNWRDIWGRKRRFNEERFTPRDEEHALNHPGSDRWTGGDKKDEL